MATNNRTEKQGGGIIKKIGLIAAAAGVVYGGAKYVKDHPQIDNPAITTESPLKDESIGLKSSTETYTIPTADAQLSSDRKSRVDNRDQKITLEQIPLIIEDWKTKLAPDFPLDLQSMKDIINLEKTLEAQGNKQITE